MNIKVVVFREGNAWVAQALERDIAAQASTSLMAVNELGLLFEAYDLIRRQHTNIQKTPAAPKYYWTMWDKGAPAQWYNAPNSIQIAALYTADVRIYDGK